MERVAQAPGRVAWRVSGRAAVLSAVACALFAVSGCGISTGALREAETDPTIVSSTVPDSPPAGVGNASDEITIQNAVSSADVMQTSGKALAWANADTGSRGSISSLVEQKRDGVLCRSFTTTRESFEGVSLYQGKTCLDQGVWRMMELKPN